MLFSRKTIGWISILLSAAISISWIIIILLGQINEPLIEISFHLFSEAIMIIMCFTGGFLIIKAHRLGKLIAVSGYSMMTYSLLNAIGYYLTKEEFILPVMFGFLILLSVTIIINLSSV